jgi:hypothetical protein
MTFAEWISTPIVCEIFVYYRSFIADNVDKPSAHDKAEGNAALEAFAQGRVELLQKKVVPGVGKVPGVYEYRAQLRREVRRPLVYGVPWEKRLTGPYGCEGQY